MTQNAKKPPERGGAGGFLNHPEQRHFTASTVENQFLEAAHAAGVRLTGSIIGDGILHRSHIEGHRSNTKNGAYILHLDNHPAGWALDYTTDHSFTWRADGQRVKLSPADKAAIEVERKRRDAERQQTHRIAKDKASFIWSKTHPIVDASQYPYLVKKRIRPHGARLSSYQGRESLVIPISNHQGRLTSLQFIDADGSKRFLSGGEIKGCFVGIGLSGVIADGGKILICEGFATGASLHEWYREPVVVAFNAGNLEPVAKQIRAAYLAAEIIICGDNDESGVGQKAAKTAAVSVNGKYLLPPVVGTDFNDAINSWRDAAGKEAGV